MGMGCLVGLACMAWLAVAGTAAAEDWPTFRHDNHRSGWSKERLPAEGLAEHWVYRARVSPQPAWAGPPKWDAYKNIVPLRSMREYDPVYHVVVQGSSLYFSSSGDDSVYCLDAATGREKWVFTTDGPVRVAPTCEGENLYFGSDDGCAYCLRASDGSLVWKYSPVDRSRRVLNNGRFIPLWPCRTGVLVADGTAYFACSMLPWTPAYLCAVDARTGRPEGPRRYVKEHAGMTMEGSLLASASQLVSPQGQVPPLVFTRSDGMPQGSLPGGGGSFATMSEDGELFHGPGNKSGWITASNTATRAQLAVFQDASSAVILGERAYVLGHRSLSAVERSTRKPLWTTPCSCPLELILAGDTLFAGGQDTVVALRCEDGKETWRSPVQGKAFGLAAAAGALFVSTHEGAIHCFRPGKPAGSASPTVAQIIATQDIAKPAAPAGKNLKPFAPSVGPYLQFTGPDTAVVRWQTAEASPTVLKYGIGQLSLQVVDDKPKQAHEAVLTGLRKDLTYEYVLCGPVDGGQGESRKYECDTFFNHRAAEPRELRNPYAEDAMSAVYAQAAERILDVTQVRQGICLVLGCEQGRLACELAKRSRLRIIGVDDDAGRVESTRKHLREAGLYGSRASVYAVESLDRLPMVEGFADLVVSDRVLCKGEAAGIAAEVCRALRPGAGVACFGQPGGPTHRMTKVGLQEWVASSSWPAQIDDGPAGTWAVLRRPPLQGAGVWTHQYGRPDNSAFGGESLAGVSAAHDLRVQWLGRPGPRAQADRNGRKPSPLAVNGRLFVQGLERITALSSDNGTVLWSLELPGFMRFNIPRDCGNWCADERHVFAAVKDRCWRIDADTGNVSMFLPVLPGKRPQWQYDWGYVARQGELLLGSAVRAGTSHTSFWGGAGWYDDRGGATAKICSDNLFARNVQSGEVTWSYTAGLILNSTLTIGADRIYFVECRNQTVVDSDARRVTAPELWRDQFLVALDVATGKKAWELSLDTKSGAVVFYLAFSDGKLVLVASDGQYHVYAFDANDGRALWDQHFPWQSGDHGGHMSRPAIVGDTVFVRPRMINLKNGELLETLLPGGGCGTYAVSEHALFFRSGNVTLWSPEANLATSWARLRPDCWLSTIPACGLVLSPEGGGGCSCGSWLETSVAFAPCDYPPPTCMPPAGKYLDEAEVALVNRVPGGVTRFTLDGSDPAPTSPAFDSPIKLTKTTTVKARTFWDKGKYGRPERGDVLIGTFTRDYPGPQFQPEGMPFLGKLEVRLVKPGKTGTIRYTLDGTEPALESPEFQSPLPLDRTATIKGRIYYEDGTASPAVAATFTKTEARAQEPVDAAGLVAGLQCDVYEGDWKTLPDFAPLTPKKSCAVSEISLQPRTRDDAFALRFRGFLQVPQDGIYMFYLSSDDGSRLFIGDTKVVDNDGIHAAQEKSAWIALKAGLHPITVEYWDAVWQHSLAVSYSGPGLKKQPIPAAVLFRKP